MWKSLGLDVWNAFSHDHFARDLRLSSHRKSSRYRIYDDRVGRRTALFQALSAFSGTGFTTPEAESIVNHPARRRITMLLMIVGTAGIATVIVSSMSHVVTRVDYRLPIDVLILVVGYI